MDIPKKPGIDNIFTERSQRHICIHVENETAGYPGYIPVKARRPLRHSPSTMLSVNRFTGR